MRKFIVVRGHAGSGKTTFAKEKIKEFKNEYPQAQIYHLENDMFLVDDKLIYYTQNAVLCNYNRRQFSKDIVKVIPVDDTLMILFKNEMKIIQNDF